MDATEGGQDRVEQAVRFLLLVALWSLWLLFRAAWGILLGLSSDHTRVLVRRVVFWGLLASFFALSPHAVGLWWSRMMLVDAAEIAALQADGKDPADIEADLRRRAFRLGFRDILAQPGAVRVHFEEREAGPVCKVVLDFRQQLKLYGWITPPLRIRASVEQIVLRQPEGIMGLRELIEGR